MSTHTDPARRPGDTIEQALGALQAIVEVQDMQEQCSLVQTDPETGHRQVIGPFPDGWAAMRAADTLARVDAGTLEAPFPVYEVLVHLSPADCGLEGSVSGRV